MCPKAERGMGAERGRRELADRVDAVTGYVDRIVRGRQWRGQGAAFADSSAIHLLTSSDLIGKVQVEGRCGNAPADHRSATSSAAY